MRDLLFIAYLFPPLGGGGVQRSLAFVEGLPKLGWRPTVVCAGSDAAYWAKDPSLLERIPEGVRVLRVPEGPLGWSRTLIRRALPRGWVRHLDQRFWVPDGQTPWIPNALAAIGWLRSRHRFDAVYSTGAPWTNHLVGLITAQTSRLPWIADFRDPWTRSPAGAALPPSARAMHQRLEAAVYAKADRIIANTDDQKTDLEAHFAVVNGKTVCIPNGYREEDFGFERPPPVSDHVLLGYAGSFYSGYGPGPLLERLERLQGSEALRGLTLRYVGKTEAYDQVESSPVPAQRLGYVSQQESLRLMGECRALMLFIPDAPQARGCVPQKLYPYLRLGRPILVVGREGEAMRIVRRAGGPHLCLTPDAPDAELETWLGRLQNGVPPDDMDIDYVRGFERKRLTARLAQELDRLHGGATD